MAIKRNISLIVFLLLSFHEAGFSQQPELVVQTGHAGMITTVAFSPNGSLLASAGSDGTVKIWDLQTGKQLRSIYGDSAPIASICISSDGRMLATAGLGKQIRTWEVATGAKRHQISTQEGVTAIAFHPSRNMLVSGGENGTVRLWDMVSGKEEQVIKKYAGAVRSFVPCRDGRLLASIIYTEPKVGIVLWDITTGREFGRFDSPGKEIAAIAIGPRGDALAIGEPDGTVRLWNVVKGMKPQLLKGHSGSVNSLAFSPDGSQLVTGAKDRTVRVWDVRTGGQLRVLIGSPRADAAVQRGPDYLILGLGEKGKLHLDDPDFLNAISKAMKPGGTITLLLGDGDRIDLGPASMMQALRGKSDNIGAVAYSPDAKAIASCVGDMIKIWSSTSGAELGTLTRRSDIITSVAFHKAKPLLASGQIDGKIALWDIDEGRKTSTLEGHRTPVRSIAFSPENNLLATGSDAGMIKLWDTDSRKELATFIGHQDRIAILDFTPDGKTLLSGSSDGTIRVWDVPEGAVLRVFRDDSVVVVGKNTSPPSHQKVKVRQTSIRFTAESFAIHPDGKVVAIIGMGNDILLYDLITGRQLQTLPADHPDQIAFSPDGASLASSAEKVVNIWDWKAGKITQTLQGANDDVVSLIFSRDGKFIIGGAVDGTVRVWDVLTAKTVHALPARLGGKNCVSLSPNNTMLATATMDAKVILWDLARGQEKASLVPTENDGYVIATQDNYYIATKGALAGIAFRFMNHAYPFDQFDLKLNRPDIVLQRLGSKNTALVEAYRQAFQKRLSKMKLTEEQLTAEVHLPEVIVTRSDPGATSTLAKRISFTVRAIDSLHPLARLNVNVNDVPVFGSGGIDLRAQGVKEYEERITIELSRGRNRVQVFALNAVGVESLRHTFEIICEAPAKPSLYVVAIGVSQYADARYNLNFASKDARDIVASFTGPQKGFEKAYTMQILDKDATRINIKKAREFLAAAGVDDTIILFLAGHGLLDKKSEYYFATTDIVFDNPHQNGLSYDELEGILDGIASRRKLLLLDTCHSGELDSARELTPAPALARGVVIQTFDAKRDAYLGIGVKNSFDLLQEKFAELRRGSGSLVIAAASGASYALESAERRNGLFTSCLLEGLTTGRADRDLDGQITVSELRDYVSEMVQQYTGGGQVPTTRRDSIEFDFPIAGRSTLPLQR